MPIFHTTKHAKVRMQQRGRRPHEIEFVLKYGTETNAGILLTRQDVEAIEKEALEEISLAHKLRNMFVPCEGGVVKTVFKANTAQQRRLLS